MDAQRYLDRIGISGPVAPTVEDLERLQRAHLTHVPFENLDVFYRRGVATDDQRTVDKVVGRGRGGWCFELNGAFATLLSALGFETTRLAATVLYGGNAPMPTHATIEVALERPYLVDVGFGDSFIRPLPLDSEGPHDGGVGRYGFRREGSMVTLVSIDERGRVDEHYRFDRTPHAPVDFEAASTYLQTEPGLQWTTGRFATRLIDGGPDRVTLLEDRLKFRRSGVWTEQPVEPEDWASCLDRWFGISP